jgi:hypothetical protein
LVEAAVLQLRAPARPAPPDATPVARRNADGLSSPEAASSLAPPQAEPASPDAAALRVLPPERSAPVAPTTPNAAPPNPAAPALHSAPAHVPPLLPDPEKFSRAAGVLLTIRALERLDLGARLAADPPAGLAGFGRHLLRHIAERGGLPEDDALLALLPAPAPLPDRALLQAWTAGLDGWLRRRAKLRLHELARKRGWLHLEDTTLQIRFRVQAADLRLRRLALDADPGWVPWLGLVVRYHYRDAPLA